MLLLTQIITLTLNIYVFFFYKLSRETNRKLFLGERGREKITGGAEEEEEKEEERVKKGSSVEIAIAGLFVISLWLSFAFFTYCHRILA